MNAGILFFVVMIVGRVIVAIIRDGKREERERQEEAYNRQATTGNTTVISPLPVAQIRVDRDSVCMGDDATAPNAVLIDLLETDLFSDMVKKVVQHLPLMPNSVWAIDSGQEVIAYVITDDRKGFYSYELCTRDWNCVIAGIKTLHCSYFCSYGEKTPPIVEAKRCMRRRFMEKLKVKDGSLCIWGEQVGQLHMIETVEWNNEEIRIRFAEGYLQIYQPTNITNEDKQLIIGSASKVLWIWYEYGKEHTNKMLHVRQFTKTAEGSILRAEGTQSDVDDDDGVEIQPTAGQAVVLEQQVSSVSHIPKTAY